MIPLIPDIGDAKKSGCHGVSLAMAVRKAWEFGKFGKAAPVHELTHPIEYKVQKSNTKRGNGNSGRPESVSKSRIILVAFARLTNQILQMSIFAAIFTASRHKVMFLKWEN